MSRETATVLTADVGTSSLKAVLYTCEGHVLDRASARYEYRAKRPGWAEADPETWWQALQDTLSDLRERQDLSQVEAVCFTGQMHSGVLLDRDGGVIPPTILWLDRRAGKETQELRDRLGLPLYQLNSTYTLPKLLWLRRHQPDVLDRTDKIIWPKDYLRFRLTGEICTDLTEPGGAALLDWDDRTWAAERLALVGLEPEVLPPIRPAAGDGGTILPEAAQSLGLNVDAKVVVGMGDVAALFGAAPPEQGRVFCSLGSSSMVFAPIDETNSIEDPADRLYVYPFGPYPLLGGVSSTTGSALVWICEIVGEAGFESCVADALKVEPGAGGLCFVPYLAGERSPYWSDDIRGGFHGLRLAHNEAHLVRAVMEGVAYSLRHLLDIYAELGVSIEEIALAGGGATTQGWPQIIADVCQRDVLIYAEEETVTRVLFALCQENLGHTTLKDALSRIFEEPRAISYRHSAADTYETGYQQYRACSTFASEQAATG
jgi:xylulokinase